jgi:trans-aconitate 2-methyltransferase
MLAHAAAHASNSVSFERGDIADWRGDGEDIVFSNAALHWIPDHPAVLARWSEGLNHRAQLAVQVPANADHPSHLVAAELASEWLGTGAPPDPVAEHVLAPEAYAELLDQLGFERQHVCLQIYPHRLHSSAEVVEWVKGTSLTRFKAILDAPNYERFVEEYRRRLLTVLGSRSPYLYTFKRIVFWGRRP